MGHVADGAEPDNDTREAIVKLLTALAPSRYQFTETTIEFCAAPTPQCRDGNRTAVLVQYTKGGERFETKGKGCAGSTASGVRIGKTALSK